MAETPKRYKPSQEQIDQLCRSRNESQAEARAFLESDTRDAKDMLAYLEYEGGQVPPDDPWKVVTKWRTGMEPAQWRLRRWARVRR